MNCVRGSRGYGSVPARVGASTHAITVADIPIRSFHVKLCSYRPKGMWEVLFRPSWRGRRMDANCCCAPSRPVHGLQYGSLGCCKSQ